MTLYVSHQTDYENLPHGSYDLAIIYKDEKLYKQIKTKKVLINKNGKIEQDNYMQYKKITNQDLLKQIVFRSILVGFNCEKS